jgi:hypothetical protein
MRKRSKKRVHCIAILPKEAIDNEADELEEDLVTETVNEVLA